MIGTEYCIDLSRLLLCIGYWLFMIAQIIVGAVQWHDAASVYLTFHGAEQLIVFSAVLCFACYGYEQDTSKLLIILCMDFCIECLVNGLGIYVYTAFTVDSTSFVQFFEASLIVNCVFTLGIGLVAGIVLSHWCKKKNRQVDPYIQYYV
jgi:hypothetical protein